VGRSVFVVLLVVSRVSKEEDANAAIEMSDNGGAAVARRPPLPVRDDEPP
jgi:hypothetical protein